MGLIHNLNIPLVSGCIFFSFYPKRLKVPSDFAFFRYSLVMSVLCARQGGGDYWCCSQSSVMNVWESIGDCCSWKNGYQGREIFPSTWILGSSLTITQRVKSFVNCLQNPEVLRASEHLILLIRKLINMSVVNRCWNKVSCLNMKERDGCCSKQLPLNQLHGWFWYESNRSPFHSSVYCLLVTALWARKSDSPTLC